jgi:hypothetical protein
VAAGLSVGANAVDEKSDGLRLPPKAALVGRGGRSWCMRPRRSARCCWVEEAAVNRGSAWTLAMASVLARSADAAVTRSVMRVAGVAVAGGRGLNVTVLVTVRSGGRADGAACGVAGVKRAVQDGVHAAGGGGGAGVTCGLLVLHADADC